MKKVFADWRNWALIIAAVAIIALMGAVNKAKEVDSSEAIVRIGNQRITEKAFIANVKKQVGDQALLAMMQRTLLEEYAAKKDITVTDADMEQLRNFHRTTAELYGQTLEDALKNQGVSPEKFDLSIRMDILNIRLVIPKDEIEKTVEELAKSGELPFTYPERFKVRRFILADAKAAEEATKILKTENGATEVAKMSMAGPSSAEIITYIPLPQREDPMMKELLKGLKPGDISKPKPLQGDKGPVALVQLVEIIPAEKPTMQNRNLAVGLMLLGNYQKEMAELEAKMMDSIEVIYYDKSKEYAGAVEEFKSLKLSNPNLPTTQPTDGQTLKGTVGISGEGEASDDAPPETPKTETKKQGQ